MTLLRFTKMQGLGNDFMVINGIAQTINLTPQVISRLADRHFGVGFDQLLLIEAPTQVDIDFTYRVFNADGNEVGQCGNGARCLARFVHEQNLTTKSLIKVVTQTTQMELSVLDNDLVKVNIGIPEFSPEKIPFIAPQLAVSYAINTDYGPAEIGALAIGNPHCVLYVENIQQALVAELGSQLQQHSRFPQGVNVGFMQVLHENAIALRVYERGAGETLACGSGACAAVVYARLKNWVNERVEVHLLGGQLFVEWAGDGQPVYLIGPAVTVFNGEIII